jgi:hypothetical protein
VERREGGKAAVEGGDPLATCTVVKEEVERRSSNPIVRHADLS